MFRLDDELMVNVHRDAVDFRKSINGFAAIVEQSKLDPFARAAYVFSNQRRDHVKMLQWERNGFWQLMKRLNRVHLGCWAHARRYMIEAEENLPKAQRGRDHPISEFIRLIGQLFAIESRCEDTTPTDRLLVRQRESHVILEQIEGLLPRQFHPVLSQSAFGKALLYLQGQWPKLNRYIENGIWLISNNACENAIRPFTVGRKN